MSTVVLTPTHIAGDHTVVYGTYPHRAVVDCHHRKIFVAPHKKCVVGTVGDFHPKDIDQPETWNAIGLILATLIAHQQIDGFSNYFFTDHIKTMEGSIDLRKAMSQYVDVFDPIGKSFIVTRDHRFMIAFDKVSEKIYGKALGPYAGIGSGGMIGTGLLIGKTPLEQIWAPLHRLDTLTSQEHTSIALSTLIPFKVK